MLGKRVKTPGSIACLWDFGTKKNCSLCSQILKQGLPASMGHRATDEWLPKELELGIYQATGLFIDHFRFHRKGEKKFTMKVKFCQ